MVGREGLLPAHVIVGDLHPLRGVHLDLAEAVPPDQLEVEAAAVQDQGGIRKDLHREVDPHLHHLLLDPDHGNQIVMLSRRIAAKKRKRIGKVTGRNFSFADISPK